MPRDLITPEEGAELKQLQQDYLDAHRRAQDAIRTSGMDSEAYLKEDAAIGAIIQRCNEILGRSGPFTDRLA